MRLQIDTHLYCRERYLFLPTPGEIPLHTNASRDTPATNTSTNTSLYQRLERYSLLPFEYYSISLSILNLIGLFSTKRSKRDVENSINDWVLQWQYLFFSLDHKRYQFLSPWEVALSANALRGTFWYRTRETYFFRLERYLFLPTPWEMPFAITRHYLFLSLGSTSFYQDLSIKTNLNRLERFLFLPTPWEVPLPANTLRTRYVCGKRDLWNETSFYHLERHLFWYYLFP